ncbi:hypothetical protein B1748_25230 [Paenibacillus sp. MY03]|uniref:DUF4091 domain-containing protein n=1 Tax=Paenibacillus sp. MY03 TaxID=302980 RepID=UPI000B3CBB03|nr:DUF4091 domain-containing protein [Paenibacillus sp. MY03]OUS72161.1 hypothetical protein B1748_25230 [Paenibacillus sp. MY03]
MTNISPVFETRCLSSLSKVFADSDLLDTEINSGTALWNEVYSFQVAYRSGTLSRFLEVSVKSEMKPYITLRSVGLAPSDMPTFAQTDDDYTRTTPGLYPDILYPVEQGVHALPHQWRSIWVTVALPSIAAVDAAQDKKSFAITLAFASSEGTHLGEEQFTLEVLPAELPPQQLIHTEWFHTDCIATQYKVEMLGEEHWELIEKYASNAARHGVNLLLTPLFTPPLDTAIGGERPTIQLIGVKQVAEHTYEFNFEKLERWIAMCERVGILYYEFSHLFTQWGAKHAPKIIAEVDGEEQRIFGWDTDAGGEAYCAFLDQFLQELVAFIEKRGIEKQVYFHISDEPHKEHLEPYRQASEMLKKHLGNFAFLDALSDYDFYQHGLVDVPIPATNHIEPFIENQVEPLWTYYCCGQYIDVANRFFGMPSYRNRIIGAQMYKFNVKGFLHWGFNFWYSQHSLKAIDPFRVTDADCGFPSGDAFVVYPGADGPLDSLRWEVFYEGLQDMRALQLLEKLVGREQTMTLLEQGLQEKLAFDQYPKSLDWLLQTRQCINAAIADAVVLA